MARVRDRIASGVTARTGAWVILAIAAVLVATVASFAGSGASAGAASSLPSGAESARVQRLLATFPDGDRAPVIAVFSRGGDPLSPSDVRAARQVGRRLGNLVGERVPPPTVSSDGEAAIIRVPVRTDLTSEQNSDLVDRLRHRARAQVPEGLTVQVTGGPAFGADIAGAFAGANVLLLAVTIAVVAVLLLLTYRSPVLWLVPLAVVGLAAELATSVDGQLGSWFGLQFDSGIISVLVFGAGTNYALLLISRYREELRHAADHRAGLAEAWRATAPAILASNATVVLALLTLVFASVPSTSGLGVAAAVGLVIALVFGLFVLPAALAVCGRGLFWPLIPRPADAETTHTGLWARIASGVLRRPRAVLASSVVVLAVLACGLFGAQLGLSQTEKFRVSAESVDGFDTVSAHFPPGSSEPVTILSRSGRAQAVARVAAAVGGVDRATVVGTSPAGRSRILATTVAAPGTESSNDTVRDLRDAVHRVAGADALVGGQVAENLDTRTASIHDLKLIVPLILAVVFLVLLVLLRALVASAVLIAVNIASALAAIGAGTWAGVHVFGFPALDVNVPLLAFLFLVALGIDYTIFLVTRAREEAHDHGTGPGMARAVATTGGVITSAGIVLAAVFAALGVLPLMTLAQLGLIVCLGVLIDTMLVRTVVVPAVFAVIGRHAWWPGSLARAAPGNTATTVQPSSAGAAPPDIEP